MYGSSSMATYGTVRTVPMPTNASARFLFLSPECSCVPPAAGRRAFKIPSKIEINVQEAASNGRRVRALTV